MAIRGLMSTMLLALLVVGRPEVAAGQPNGSMTSLGLAVEAFLVEWMRGSPEVAAQRYISTFTVQRPQLLPTSRSSSQPRALSPGQAFAAELASIRRELWANGQPDWILAPTRSLEALPDIMTVIKDLGLEVTPLERPPALAFRIQRWADLAWCGSAGPRHRTIFNTETLRQLQPVGVIARLRSASETEAMPVLLVWQLEPGAAAGPNWKVLTLLQILTN